MMSNLEKAVKLLKNGNYTLVAVNDNWTAASTQRGVKPLLDILDDRKNLHGFSVADKVIGKAAAFLYVLHRPAEIYANVISKPALNVLKQYEINIEYSVLADAIKNCDNTGFCPMETAVINAETPDEALILIREKFMLLNRKV